ncbi:MAG: aminoglycoside phosphotransferase family protein [Gammaproteobacteria bacterium]|jgi:thiamine kinase-like enzyme
MSTHTDDQSVSNDDDVRLQARIGACLTAALGRTVDVVSLTRQRSPYATVFPAEIITVQLDDASRVSLFAKYIGSEQAEHPDKACRDREPRVYRELFAGADLPVVQCFSAAWDEASQRYELLLEHIDGWNLKYHELTHWYAAAVNLARLQNFFAHDAERLKGCSYLLQLNEAYFHQWADRALTTVSQLSPKLEHPLRAVVSGYSSVAALLAEQPPTLVHNDLSPKNVLADLSAEPPRIRFIDWEMAGVGCGLLDLVHLKYGLEPAADDAMIQAYRGALETAAWLPKQPEAFDRLLAACELHKSLYRIAHAGIWQLPEATITQWIEREVEPSFEAAKAR